MSKPTFVFFPGAWHSTNFFDKIISRLEQLGYRCVAVHLPSVGRVPPTKDLEEDIKIIRDTVLRELEAGRDVVPNAHSWSGIPMSSALHGLGKNARQQAGLPGGVTKLTYVTAFLVPEGQSVLDTIGGLPPVWVVDDDGNVTYVDDLIENLYHDVPRQDAEKMIAGLKPHSLGSFQAKMKSPVAWKEIPAAYLVCEEDKALPAMLQDAMIQGAKEAGADIVVERLAASHSPHLSQPEAVVDFLRRAAGETLSK